jgi:hypothetical protein
MINLVTSLYRISGRSKYTSQDSVVLFHCTIKCLKMSLGMHVILASVSHADRLGMPENEQFPILI